jgi:hypothetical protein
MNEHLMDIVLQGPMHDYTPTIAVEYSKLPFVNNVIISCWDSCPIYEMPSNIKLVCSSDSPTTGFGNRNRQIKSSRNGLEYVMTEFCAKLRTDQFVSLDSMHKLYNYYFSNCEINSPFKTATPYNKIGVHGVCRDFAFHPIDHIFWGNAQDLVKFFDIEYDTQLPTPSGKSDFDNYIRSETYITLPYVLHHYNELLHLKENYTEYLLDNSPLRREAISISEQLMPTLFYVFPKIELNWIKYGMPSYHYEVMESERGGHAYWSPDNL